MLQHVNECSDEYTNVPVSYIEEVKNPYGYRETCLFFAIILIIIPILNII